MVPLAPARFSTITGWPSTAVPCSANSRAITSTPPPAANGTMTWMVRSGNAPCAKAGAIPRTAASSVAIRRLSRHELATQVFLDMHADDLVEGRLDQEAEFGGALAGEAV